MAYKAWSAWLRDVSQNRAFEAEQKALCRADFYSKNIGTGVVPDSHSAVCSKRSLDLMEKD
jgi:hypothetical protein